MTLQGVGGIVLPVFGLIGIGYAAARLKILEPAIGDALGIFVTTLAIPILIFKTLTTADLGAASPWPLWIAYVTGITVSWIAAGLVSRRVFGASHTESVVAGVSASYSNMVLIGIPFMATAFGEAGTVPLFILISVHTPLMYAVGTLLVERAVHLDAPAAERRSVAALVRKIVVSILGNTIIVAILLGGAARLVGIAPSGPVKAVLDSLGAAAVPCALVGLGMALTRYGIAGQVRATIAISVLKLLIMPVVVLAMCRLLGLPPLWTSVATVTAALPAGFNSYLMAQQFGAGHGLAASTITLSTAVAVVSATLWLELVTRL